MELRVEINERKTIAMNTIVNMLKSRGIDSRKGFEGFGEINDIGNHSIRITIFEQMRSYGGGGNGKLILKINGTDCPRSVSFPEGKSGFKFDNIIRKLIVYVEYAEMGKERIVEEEEKSNASLRLVEDLNVEFGPDELGKICLQCTKNPKLVNVSINLNMTIEQARKFIKMMGMI